MCLYYVEELLTTLQLTETLRRGRGGGHVFCCLIPSKLAVRGYIFEIKLCYVSAI